MEIVAVSREIAGRTFAFETGRVAKQANGAVLVGVDDTVVLVAATMSKNPRAGADFFPLTCDYEERKYSVGKVPGGFIKRGGRPSEKAVLTSRLIDRPLRPLFPEGMRNDVQVIATTLSCEPGVPSDVLAVTGGSAALSISDIPFAGPIACVRVALIDGELVALPSVEQMGKSDLDLIVAGNSSHIVMVEAGAVEIPEEKMIEAIGFGHEIVKQICDLQNELAEKVGKAKMEVQLYTVPPELFETVRTEAGADIDAALRNPDKLKREAAVNELKSELAAKLQEKFESDEEKAQVVDAIEKLVKKTVRQMVLDETKRLDGRGPKDIRDLSAEVGFLPRTHGSGLFTRGQTQVLTVVTLAPLDDAQIVDGLEEDYKKRYMHFYNFLPYCTGETRPMRAASRREVGHGALAERALRSVIPSDEEFPYAMLLTSEVLESNGSSSMGSVCGSTLALMDAGVPIKAPVSGIAMGMVSDETRHVVLTDIQGIEDACGDMDFKVAGTADGITALQLDAKVGGLTHDTLREAMADAREARLKVMDCILQTIPEPRASLSQYAPRIFVIDIDPSKIGEVIGPGGRVIQRICAETSSEIDIEQTGRVYIASPSQEMGELAVKMVRDLTTDPVVGEEYAGTVTRLIGRGAFVEFLPGRDGLVPLEKLTRRRIRRPEDVVQVGDKVRVKIDEVDHLGRLNLTALGMPQTLESLTATGDGQDEGPPPSYDRPPSRSFGGGGGYGDRGGGGGRGGDRGPQRRGGPGGGGPPRGGGGPDRPRGDRGDRGPRPERRDDRPAQGPPQQDAPAPAAPAPEVQEESPHARFRPRR